MTHISICKTNSETVGLVNKQEKSIWDPQTVIHNGRTGCSFACQIPWEENIQYLQLGPIDCSHTISTMGEKNSWSKAPPGAGGSGMPNALGPVLASTEEDVLFSLQFSSIHCPFSTPIALSVNIRVWKKSSFLSPLHFQSYRKLQVKHIKLQYK